MTLLTRTELTIRQCLFSETECSYELCECKYALIRSAKQNKCAKMALDHLPECFRGQKPFFLIDQKVGHPRNTFVKSFRFLKKFTQGTSF